MSDATHTKCTECRGFGSTVAQEPHTTCGGEGCGQCREGKVPSMRRCEKCDGKGYVEAPGFTFKITYQ